MHHGERVIAPEAGADLVEEVGRLDVAGFEQREDEAPDRADIADRHHQAVGRGLGDPHAIDHGIRGAGVAAQEIEIGAALQLRRREVGPPLLGARVGQRRGVGDEDLPATVRGRPVAQALPTRHRGEAAQELVGAALGLDLARDRGDEIDGQRRPGEAGRRLPAGEIGAMPDARGGRIGEGRDDLRPVGRAGRRRERPGVGEGGRPEPGRQRHRHQQQDREPPALPPAPPRAKPCPHRQCPGVQIHEVLLSSWAQRPGTQVEPR